MKVESGPSTSSLEGVRDDLAALLRARRGHFELESGHHGDLWLDLESLFAAPAAVRPLAAELALQLAQYRPEVVCGPLVEGAFVGLQVAEELGINFVYTEPKAKPLGSGELFPIKYELPGQLRRAAASRRVVIVNDVINAGSSLRGTLEELRSSGAEVVAIGALLKLGRAPDEIARGASLPLMSLASAHARLFPPASCPLCAEKTPLVPHPGS